MKSIDIERSSVRIIGAAAVLAVAVGACRTGEIARDVEHRLADAGIDSVEVRATPSRGVVVLRGQVDSAAGRRLAEEIARATPGVVRVDDEVVVLQPPELTAATPEDRAAAAAGSWLAAERLGTLHVEAMDGGVRVVGAVSARDHDRALAIVSSAVPAPLQVRDETVVR